jgi:O-antigen/teichoic acid export membrane protein
VSQPNVRPATRPGRAPTPSPDSLLKNVTWLGAASAAVSPLWFGFITYLCLSRLSPEAYGTLNWALWLMTIVAATTDLGLSDFVTREVARQRDQAWRYFSNFVVLRAGLGVVVLGSVLGIGAVAGVAPERLTALALAGVYAVSVFLIAFCRVFFRAFEVLRYESLSLISEKLLVLSGGTIMLFATGTAIGTLIGMTTGMVMAVAATLWWVVYRIAPFEPGVIKLSFLKANLRKAAPLSLFAIAVVANLRVGPVILEFFHGAEEVGRFGAAYRIVEAMLLLPALATAALLPRLSSLWGRGETALFDQLVRRALLMVGLASGFLGLCLGIGGGALMNVIVSDPAAYAGAGLWLRILGLAYPAMCLNSVLAAVLIASDGQRFLGRFMALVTLAVALLYAVAIPQFGTPGLLVVFVGSLYAVLAALFVRFRLLTAPAAPA